MSSSEYTTDPAANPLAPVEQLVHWLTSTTIHLAIGLPIGLVAATAMRRRHLRWTWSAGALVSVVLARGVLGGGALTLGMAALCATVRGRRWHREDVEAGADLADVAAGRHGPLDALRSLARKAEVRWSSVGAESRWRGDRLAVGCERDGRVVTIPLGGATGGTHTLVVGATRSGKTVTMTWMVAHAIERGMGAIVIDPKGDLDLRRELRDAALAHGRRFVEWAPRGHTVYNPYARGSETEIADKVLAGERFTEPHYLRQAQRYLGHEVRVLRKAGIEGQSEGAGRVPGHVAIGVARSESARGTSSGSARVPGLAHDAPAERSGRRARSVGDHGRVRHRTVARTRKRRTQVAWICRRRQKHGLWCISTCKPTSDRCWPRCSERRSSETCRRRWRDCRDGRRRRS